MSDARHATSSSPTNNRASRLEALRGSPLLKLILLAALVLLLQVPIAMIDSTISDRRAMRRRAVSEVTSTWGGAQLVRGPMLVVPFDRQVRRSRDGRTASRSEVAYAHFLPEQLEIEGSIDGEVRRRTIFRVPVYRSHLVLSGRFSRPDLSRWKVAPDDIHWDRAYLTLHVANPHAIANAASVSWNGRRIALRASAGPADTDWRGVHAPLEAKPTADRLRFRIAVRLDGSTSMSFAPTAGRTQVKLKSSWPDPSFQGRWLPRQRRVTDEGFTARWDIPALGRDFPQAWIDGRAHRSALRASRFGVALLAPVDPYRMSERSITYQVLFLALTFLSLWLFEVLGGLRIHPVQYLLVGAAQCLFFLLQLALAEHLGFASAYAIASGSVVMLLVTYCAAVLRRRRRATAIAAVVAGVYGYLYAVLQSESYALLSGSIALFAALGGVMLLTRRIDWYSFGRARRDPDREISDPLDEAFAALEQRSTLPGPNQAAGVPIETP